MYIIEIITTIILVLSLLFGIDVVINVNLKGVKYINDKDKRD